jgi:NAD(P)-dependent dehydrogenase (short-subunit alcohol dehydrogenase family)
MTSDLEGRAALVTGAGRGFGRAAARCIAERGCDLVLVSRTPDEIRETAELIVSDGGREPLVFVADVSSPDDVDALKAAAESAYGTVGLLLNAAGVFGPVSQITRVDPQRWTATLMINTIGPMLTCRAFAPAMLEAGWGRIVNVSSSTAFMEPDAVISAYATSKVALNHFTRHLAAELAGTGVTANAIHPGSLKTEMWRDIRDSALGTPRAEKISEWADMIERTGGDAMHVPITVLERILDDRDGAINGAFLWPENSIEPPVPTW